MADEAELLERITINPGVRSGKPTIRNMRLAVHDVLGYLAAGMSQDEVLEEFPELEPQDIQACYAYAAQLLNGVRIVEAA